MDDTGSIGKSVCPAYGNIIGSFQVLGCAIWAVAVLFLVCGCSSHVQPGSSPLVNNPDGSISDACLPRSVYAAPEQNVYSSSRAVIQTFGAPYYTEGVGAFAARSLSRQLLQEDVFSSVRLESEQDSFSMREWEHILAQEDCDLLITGKVLFFLEGSSQQPSKALVETKAFEMAGGSLHLLWHMQAEEVSEPRSAKDLYIFRLPPVPALSGQDLIQRCTAQFTQAFLHLPPRQDAEHRTHLTPGGVLQPQRAGITRRREALPLPGGSR
ncbi:MAG: hypothetical protein R6V55_00310 [Desulfovermiculus sp.]